MLGQDKAALRVTMRGATRIAPAAVGERAHAVARVVQEVADQVGATPAQVAIAWTMARSLAIHRARGRTRR